MKITYQWLKQYVDFPWTAEELSERLTMLGLEVEGIEKRAGEFEGVVVARVLTRDKHPNADKLSVCRVEDGRGERQIVCGAQNFKAGDKVPLILPGATLPPKAGETAPFTIKVGKIRGVESHGMMCSAEELGLPPKEDGLLLLDEQAVVGQAFAEHMGRSASDVIYDLEVTPNRPDLNSVIGIAREIAALTGNPLRWPSVEIPQGSTGAVAVAESVQVRIEAPDLCPRYTARVIRGVKIGASPEWLKQTLEKAGVRSINNVVDVTNYVMLECGQPLHAFDYHLIAKGADGKPTIVVRRALESEKFTTLDGQQRTLTTEMLLIADAQKGIALAGIMGGANTEIRDDTKDVLIESAYFAPTNIRRTSKQLGLRSESSYRFERGADIGIADWASQRAAQLILQTAGGQLAEGCVDAHPAPVVPREITLRHPKVNELLGLALKPEDIECYLSQLGLRSVSRKVRPVDDTRPPEPLTVRVPTFRVDLKREVDLIEEIARLHGVDKIPATTPRGAVGANAFDAIHDQIADARRILCALGLNEAQGQTLVGNGDCAMKDAQCVALDNPLSADMDVLRPSLLPGLLAILRHNLSRKNHDVAIFEVGRVFTRSEGTLREERRIAIAVTGARAAAFWSGAERDAKFDIHDLKGILEEFLDQFGVRPVLCANRSEPTELFLESATLALGGKLPLGELGQLSPVVAKRLDLRDAVLLAELNLDQLLSRRNAAKSFKPLPQQPSVGRDVAMLVPEATTHESVLAAVRQAKPANLESVQLFDVFRGKNVPEGQKSVAYAFTYRASDKTLTDAEVNAANAQVLDSLKTRLGAVIRDN